MGRDGVTRRTWLGGLSAGAVAAVLPRAAEAAQTPAARPAQGSRKDARIGKS